MSEFDDFVGIFKSGLVQVVIPFNYFPSTIVTYEDGEIMSVPENYECSPWKCKSSLEQLYSMICKGEAYISSERMSKRSIHE